MDTFLERILEVYIANLSANPILFNKTLVIAYVSKAPDYIVHPGGEEQKFWAAE